MNASTCQPSASNYFQKLGRNKFIFCYGMMAWGIPTAILTSVLISLKEGWEQFPVHLAINLVTFQFGGYLYGMFMWRYLQRRVVKTQ